MAQPQNQNQKQQAQGQEQQKGEKKPEATQQPSRGMETTRGQGQSGGLSRAGASASTPFSLMGQLMNDMDRMFGSFGLGGGRALASAASEWIPQLDVIQREGQLVVRADLPGLREDDVNVNVENGILTISGERSHEHEHESGGVYRCERSYGSFERSVELPDGIDPEQVQASFDRGVLEVTIPVPKEGPKGRSIPIRSGGETPPPGARH